MSHGCEYFKNQKSFVATYRDQTSFHNLRTRAKPSNLDASIWWNNYSVCGETLGGCGSVLSYWHWVLVSCLVTTFFCFCHACRFLSFISPSIDMTKRGRRREIWALESAGSRWCRFLQCGARPSGQKNTSPAWIPHSTSAWGHTWPVKASHGVVRSAILLVYRRN